MTLVVDQAQAIAHLNALGYQDSETVYFRSFFPDGNPLKQRDKGRKLEGKFPKLPWKQIEQLQVEGRGCYFVVNGWGHVDKAVKQGRAIFFEHDDLDKDTQRSLWQTLELPEPSIQVDTGGKSIHSYWRVDCTVEQWKELQLDLMKFANSDRTLKNTSRVMRLAGAWHIQPGRASIQSTIILNTGNAYSYQELRRFIPRQSQQQPQSIEESIPLAVCLTRDDRDLIERGTAQGERNGRGFALATNLIATADYLRGIAQPFEGDPRQLFEHYVANCTPPIEQGELEEIWKSASQRPKSPSLSVDAIENCIKAQQWKQNHKGRQINGQHLKRQTAPKPEPRASQDPQGRRTNQQTQTETPEPDEDLQDELQQLISHTQHDYDLSELFHENLATPFKQLAHKLGIPAIAYSHNLLPVAASLLKTRACLEISATTEHLAPAIIWTGLVAPSGSTKSPPHHHCVQPLVDLEYELHQQFLVDHKAWEKAVQEWQGQDPEQRGDKPEEPKQRDLYFQDATLEAIAADIAKYPDCGALIAVDELAAFFNGQGEYKNNRGSDRQRWLSCYDGRALKVSRKTSKGIRLQRTSLSTTGTIQPEVLKRLMGDLQTVDGLWPRYLWVTMPLSVMPPPEEGPQFDLGDRLLGLYRYLDSLEPQTFKLSRDAKAVWRQWHLWTEETKVEEGHPALRAVYPKAREQAARIALVTHCINSHLTGQLSETVSAQTLTAAINYVKCCISHTRLIYADFGLVDNPQSAKITRFIERFKHSGWVKPRQVCRWSSSSDTLTATTAKEFMAQVVTLGYAITNGTNPTDKTYQIKVINGGDTVPNDLKPIQRRKQDSVPNSVPNNYGSVPNIQNYHLDPNDPGNKVTNTHPSSNQTMPNNGANFVTEVVTDGTEFGTDPQPTQNKALTQFGTVSPTNRENQNDIRAAVTVAQGKTELEHEKPVSAIATPEWKPTSSVPNNYGSVPKLFLDIETKNSAECDNGIQVGSTVGKKGRHGWVGKVLEIKGDIAEVLWSCERYPTSVPISELRLVS